ncbi:hypothetical protein QTO34_009929 [Cnephaeus nilssonii]|uniref:EH domain-containing protein n=1 Tax=Cnephaeus nilssonii TaxID=3371016 RepID=A0AA40LDT2_CNENI|nr:hypothetical protein QTO34_009929 [Eptesicus nilssonii]
MDSATRALETLQEDVVPVAAELRSAGTRSPSPCAAQGAVPVTRYRDSGPNGLSRTVARNLAGTVHCPREHSSVSPARCQEPNALECLWGRCRGDLEGAILVYFHTDKPCEIRLPDLTLGQVWALADPEGKGVLSKGQLFIALCLQHFTTPIVPCWTAGPLQRVPWAVKSEDKDRHGAILYRFKPRTWISVCDKGKPASLTSKLPVAAHGSVCELTGVGHGAKLTEMSLQVPWHIGESPCAHVLASSLVPPAKRKAWVGSSAEKLKRMASSWTLIRTWMSLCLDWKFVISSWRHVNQMLIKVIDPPLIFTPDVLPPPDRAVLLSYFSAIKELDALNNDTIDLKRDKNNVQEDLKEKEGTLFLKFSSEDMAQKKQGQGLLNGLDDQEV